ncbi:MAG: EI24 domain-containing protein [Rhodospirillales bacterium]
MIGAFAKAIGQFGDPAIRGVLWIGIGASLAVFVSLWGVAGYLLTSTALFSIGWLDTAVDVLGGLATAILTWLFFPAVVSGTVGLLLDRVAGAVERRHYPTLPPARQAPIAEVVATTAKFLAVMVGLNLVILLFLPFPPVFPFVFYAVNGYLLGREYFELVALRRVDAAEVETLRGRFRGRMFLAGVVTAVLLTVPVVNLAAPIIGTAAMVHLFERWRARA